MKLAIPTREEMVDDHFGHCDFFTVVDIVDGKVESSVRVESPQGCGCKSDIAQKLSKMGVKVMLAGNIGQGAINKLAASSIQVIRGCKGEISSLLDAFLKGELHDNAEICSNHECHHTISLLEVHPL
ncbi:MAG: NifB/NifX family molybdenum-iron cluster-binding protein [Alistipes sp.]|nr:NifB/NifX family molybdenum-iron cluster-binding protein [Candidatus Alistipes equi]